MTNSPKSTPRELGAGSSGGGGAMFLFLVLLAMAAFAPCVLVPEWRAYQALDVQAQVQQNHLDELNREIEARRRVLDALSSDPAAMARLAQRELRYRRPIEQAVSVRPVMVDDHASGPNTFQPVAPHPPAMIQRLVQALPTWNYDAVFCDPPTRKLIEVMAIALIALAWALSTSRSAYSPSRA